MSPTGMSADGAAILKFTKETIFETAEDHAAFVASMKELSDVEIIEFYTTTPDEFACFYYDRHITYGDHGTIDVVDVNLEQSNTICFVLKDLYIEFRNRLSTEEFERLIVLAKL